MANTTANPEYRKIFQEKIDLKLYVVIATISLSGLPKSRTKTINPAMRKAIANKKYGNKRREKNCKKSGRK